MTHGGMKKLNFNFQGPIKRLQIEKYLDDNPEFLENYILTKIQFGTLERWQNQMNAGRPLITDNLNSITVNIEQDDVDEVVQPLNLRPEGYYVQQVIAEADSPKILFSCRFSSL